MAKVCSDSLFASESQSTLSLKIGGDCPSLSRADVMSVCRHSDVLRTTPCSIFMRSTATLRAAFSGCGGHRPVGQPVLKSENFWASEAFVD